MSGLPTGMTLQLSAGGVPIMVPMMTTAGATMGTVAAAPTPAVASSVIQTIPSQAIRTVDAAAAAKRNKKRKMPERSMPDKVSHIIPESSIFNALQSLEKGLDRELKRYKTKMQHTFNPVAQAKRFIRLYVLNTHHNQKPAAGSNSSSSDSGPQEPPYWVLCLNGRVMTPEQAAGVPGALAAAAQQEPGSDPWTRHLRRLEIDIVGGSYPADQRRIVWDKDSHQGPFRDCLEFRKTGTEPVEVQLSLQLDWCPERYQLPDALAEVLGLQYGYRQQVMSAIWNYARAKLLQSRQEPDLLELDGRMEKALGQKQIKLTDIPDWLSRHLLPMPPICFNYTVKLDGDSPSRPDCYDLDFQVPLQPLASISSVVDKVAEDPQIASMEARIAQQVAKINEHRRRRAFYLGFAQSPLDFINSVIASQARDLRVGSGYGAREFEAERRSEVFRQSWVQDAAMRYLQRRSLTG